MLKVRRAWNDVFQVLKENNCQPRLLYPAKLSFIIEGEMKPLMINKNLSNLWPQNQHCRRHLKESYMQKMKINSTMKIQSK
jgi:hypothetical protein